MVFSRQFIFNQETKMFKRMNQKANGLQRRLFTVGLTALLASTALPATAQTAAWPSKPIRLVVGFAPGGGTDVMARSLSQILSESLGQPVVIDNKPGASGNLAATDVSKAAPDGYTFLVAPTSVETANPYLFKSSLVPSRDLSPVMGIGRMQMYLVARPGLEAKNVKDLVALAKSNPGKLNYSSSGAGTPPIWLVNCSIKAQGFPSHTFLTKGLHLHSRT